MISVGFVRSGTFGQALAFEPNPNNYRLLEKNIAQNGLTEKITAFNVALSDRKETLAMELSKKNYGDHRIREKSHEETGDHYGESGRKVINVESVTLDDLLANVDSTVVEQVSLVWMDIQGHEGKFLKGARHFIATHPHVPVAMEFWPYGIRRSGMSKEEFCSVVKELFQKFYILDEQTPQLRDIQSIDAYFEEFSAPDTGAHLIFVNEPVVQ